MQRIVACLQSANGLHHSNDNYMEFWRCWNVIDTLAWTTTFATSIFNFCGRIDGSGIH